MPDLRHRTLVSVRAYLDFLNANTNVFARSHLAEFGKPFSFDRAESSMTGLESLLGLRAADGLGLFATTASKRQQLTIESAEATADAECPESIRVEPGRTNVFAALLKH